MGLWSKFRKSVNGILKGALKTFAKVMSNKYVRAALMIATLVVPVLGAATAAFSSTTAAGGSFLSALGNAGMAAAKMVGSMVVKAVTTPIKMLAQGGSEVAGMFNANGLASTLQNAANTVGGTANSMFGTIKTDSLGQIMGKMGIGDGAAAAGNPAVAQASGAVVDTAQGVTETAGGAATSSGSLLDSGKDLSQFGSPSATIQAGRDVAGVNLTGGGAYTNTLGAAGAIQQPQATGLLGKTLDFMNKNPEATKLVGTMVNSAMAPDEADLLKAKIKAQNDYDKKNAAAWDSFNANVASTQPQSQAQAVPDWRARAQTARDFINNNATYGGATNSLLNRVRFQGA